MECAKQLRLGKEMTDFYGMEHVNVTIPELVFCEMTWYELKDFQEKLVEFFKSISNFSLDFAKKQPNNEGGSHLIGRPGMSCGSNKFVLPTKAFKAAKELCLSLQKAAISIDVQRNNMRSELMAEVESEREKIYNEGVEHGRDLLRQLNNGEITHNEFKAKQKYKPKDE